MKAYLANGLFSLGDRMVNEEIASQVRIRIPGLELYVPQENNSINNKSNYASSLEIEQADTEKLLESDVLIAVIDGAEIDSGVAAEIGVFSTTGRPIYALYTDVRQQGSNNQSKVSALVNDTTENQFFYRNLYVIGLIKKNGTIHPTIRGLVSKLIADLYSKGKY